MVKKLILSLMIYGLCYEMSYSQIKNSNHFFLEGGGQAIIYSVNYERIITENLGVRVGYSYLPILANLHLIPITLNGYYPLSTDKRILAECDLGSTYVKINKTILGLGQSTSNFQSLWFGLRSISKEGKSVFRFGGMIYYQNSSKKIKPWLGISAGGMF